MLLAMKTRNVIGVSIHLSSQFNSRLVLIKLSVFQSFSHSWFCLTIGHFSRGGGGIRVLRGGLRQLILLGHQIILLINF